MTRALVFASVATIVVANLSTAAGSEEATAKGVLVVEEERTPGASSTFVELTYGWTSLRAKVSSWSNPPTDDYGTSGNFHSVYLVLSGRPHADPDSLDSPEALLKALEQLPLTITDKGEEKVDGRDWLVRRRYEIASYRYPKQPTPEIAFAIAHEEEGAVEIRLTRVTQRAEQRTRIVEKQGRKVPEQYLVFLPEKVQDSYPLAGDGVQVIDTDGTELEPQVILRLLEKESPVLVSWGRRVDPRYLEVVRPGTPNLVLPAERVIPSPTAGPSVRPPAAPAPPPRPE